MKKLLVVLGILSIGILVACNDLGEDEVRLPDLEGYQKEEIIEVFEDLGVEIYFVYNKPSSPEEASTFIGYGQFYLAGDIFDKTKELPIILYDTYEDLSVYFFSEDIPYDGPFLDVDRYQDIDVLDPRGGFFVVEEPVCTDGDTAVFDYPAEVYEEITSGAKSTRFLNMDTPETYPGGEEEWEKPASLFTCAMLHQAEEILIQTDPNDHLLGNYGRLLGWVWIKLDFEEQFYLLNYMVVRQGLGEVAYEYGAGETIYYGEYSYNEWMHLAENRAMDDGFGMWGNRLDYYWNYTSERPNENWD